MFDAASFRLVAKSLQLDRFRMGLIATIAAVVATNSTLVFVTVGAAGRLLAVLLTFFSALLPVFFLSVDVMRGAGNNVDTLQAVGATKRTILLLLLMGLVMVGAAGAAAGVALVTLILHSGVASVLLPPTIAQPSSELAIHILYVLSSSIGGITIGAVAGARRAWERWY